MDALVVVDGPADDVEAVGGGANERGFVVDLGRIIDCLLLQTGHCTIANGQIACPPRDEIRLLVYALPWNPRQDCDSRRRRPVLCVVPPFPLLVADHWRSVGVLCGGAGEGVDQLPPP